MNEFLELFVRRVKEIPTIPVAAQRIMALMREETVTLDRMEAEIETDPAIAAKILCVANSAFFRSPVPVTTIRQSLLCLGFSNVSSIALGIALLTFYTRTIRTPLDPKAIYNHSLAVGSIAQSLAERFGLSGIEGAFVSGMLHDLGLLVLNSHFIDRYELVVTEFRAGKSLLEAEKGILGATHAVVGTWLADSWNLPESILAGITYHHTPSQTDSRLASLIHLSDYLALNMGYGFLESSDFPLSSSAFDVLGISSDDLTDIEEIVRREGLAEALFA